MTKTPDLSRNWVRSWIRDGREEAVKVAKRAKEEGNDDLVGPLERRRAQAEETEARGTEVASSFEGKNTRCSRRAGGEEQGAGDDETYLTRPPTRSTASSPDHGGGSEVGHWE